jgi:hypothetical protein
MDSASWKKPWRSASAAHIRLEASYVEGGSGNSKEAWAHDQGTALVDPAALCGRCMVHAGPQMFDHGVRAFGVSTHCIMVQGCYKLDKT